MKRTLHILFGVVVSATLAFGQGSPANPATAANQLTANNTLSSILSKIPSFGAAGSASANVLTVQGSESMTPLLVTGASNITTKFREAFEAYTPGVNWTQVTGSGDIVQVDGNTAGASYLVISKNPLAQDTTTTLESVARYNFPLDMSLGLHRSQAALGTEFSIELVDDNPPATAPADLAIAAIQQATTTLTITTTIAHGLVPGRRIQISGVPDSRLNYPALVVSNINSPTQFTVAAGPGGSLPSVTAGPFSAGTVSFRSAMGYSENGTSMIFENATATNASFYVRSEAGDANPSGTVTGNHAVTVISTASTALVSGPFSYAWSPTGEYRLSVMVDRIQWSDGVIDSTGQTTSRFNRTQIVPSIDHQYKLRIRSTNNKSLTVPVAPIVSISKAGSTTWTVNTVGAHTLTTGDFINIYGNRDTSNFPNLTTATVVASIVDADTFTVVSTTGTATGYGGTVYRVNGGNLPSALGASPQVVQSASRTGNIVTLTGSATWTGMSIGDYVNLHGVRNATDGGDVGIDGPYRVQNAASATLTLEPLVGAPTGTDIGSVNAGGTVIRRTDLRISFVRVLDHERLRVEALARPSADSSSAFPVVVQGGTSIVTTSSSGITVAGRDAEDAAPAGNPFIVGGLTTTGLPPNTVVAGDLMRNRMSPSGQLITKANSVRDLDFQVFTTVTNNAQTPIRAAQAAGIRQNITSVTYQNTNATATTLTIQDGATTIFQISAPASMAAPVHLPFFQPLFGTAATALNYTAGTTGANVLLLVTGFNSY